MPLAQLTAGAREDIRRRRVRVRALALAEGFDPRASLKKLSRAVEAARVHVGSDPTAGHPLGSESGQDFFAQLFEEIYLVIWSWEARTGGPTRIEAICHTGVLGVSPATIRTLGDAVAHGLLRIY